MKITSVDCPKIPSCHGRWRRFLLYQARIAYGLLCAAINYSCIYMAVLMNLSGRAFPEMRAPEVPCVSLGFFRPLCRHASWDDALFIAACFGRCSVFCSLRRVLFVAVCFVRCGVFCSLRCFGRCGVFCSLRRVFCSL